jgi:hypothetical protein
MYGTLLSGATLDSDPGTIHIDKAAAEGVMRLRSASILVAGLALSGCVGVPGGTAAFGGPYDYAYGGPYVEPGYAPAYGYQPGYVAPYAYQPAVVAPFAYEQPDWRRHDRDRYGGDDWARRNGNWNSGQPRVWAGHPVNIAPPPAPRPAPPPAPPVHAPDARTQQFMNALGFKPNH